MTHPNLSLRATATTIISEIQRGLLYALARTLQIVIELAVFVVSLLLFTPLVWRGPEVVSGQSSVSLTRRKSAWFSSATAHSRVLPAIWTAFLQPRLILCIASGGRSVGREPGNRDALEIVSVEEAFSPGQMTPALRGPFSQVLQSLTENKVRGKPDDRRGIVEHSNNVMLERPVHVIATRTELANRVRADVLIR